MTALEHPGRVGALDAILDTRVPTSLGSQANVVLQANGYVIPRIAGRARLRLTPAHLALMSVLSAPLDERLDRRTRHLDPLDADIDWDTVIADLRDRDLLVAGDPPDPPPTVRGAAAPPVDGDVHPDAPGSPGSPDAPATTRGAYGRVMAPFALHPHAGLFEVVDRDGRVVTRLDLDGLDVLARLCEPAKVADVPGAAAVLEPLVGTPFVTFRDSYATAAEDLQLANRLKVRELERLRVLVTEINRHEEATERRRVDGAGRRVIRVFPVSQPLNHPSLALGMILANARAYKGGVLNERYDLDPYWLVRRRNLRRILEDSGPAIFLFSDYIWSSSENRELSQLVKELSPESLTIHGGPDVPRYEGDTERFLRDHPYVDVAARNEGEFTVCEVLEALDGELLGGVADRRRLRDVAGIAYLDGDEVVRTPDRERISDLDELPSPFTSGVFEAFRVATIPFVTIETNRGCPYGCTFCDWGSATMSRLRKFSLDRVFAEIDWVAENKMDRLYIGDANFGIFERDVQIAEHIAERKKATGYPRWVQTSFAKNTVKHSEKIVRALVDADITGEGILSLQTTDPDTLDAIARTNIKTEKYLELAATFRREKLPLFTDLMLGLPGSTFESFASDLQFTMDHDVPARVYRTELLVNTPMNDPAYREKHQIVIEEADDSYLADVVGPRRKSLLLSTASYTADDLRRSMRLRGIYALAENYGVLRHVARFAHQVTGMREVDLYQELDRRTAANPSAYPYLRWAFETLEDTAIPPVSWSRFFDDVARCLVVELGVPDDGALRTVLAVQLALVPDRGRVFPQRVALEHDYVAWFERAVELRDAGEDWWVAAPTLGSFGPGFIEVSDPADVCGQAMGGQMDLTFDGNWELASPVSRAMPRQHVVV